MKFLLLIILLFSVGCITTPTKNYRKRTPYRDKLTKKIENCVIRLVREGIDERLVYRICDNIYRKKRYRKIEKR